MLIFRCLALNSFQRMYKCLIIKMLTFRYYYKLLSITAFCRSSNFEHFMPLPVRYDRSDPKQRSAGAEYRLKA